MCILFKKILINDLTYNIKQKKILDLLFRFNNLNSSIIILIESFSNENLEFKRSNSFCKRGRLTLFSIMSITSLKLLGLKLTSTGIYVTNALS